MESRWLRAALRIWVALVLVFLFIPIVLIVLYAFNPSNIESWPIAGFSLHWFSVAWHDPRSQRVPAVSAGRADRHRAGRAARLGASRTRCTTSAFFGREAISFLLVLPLALPGIITGIALNSFFSFTGIQLATLTIVIGHATFCIVVVFNNLIARLRRTPGSLAEASQDLGARGWQTLRYVTLPLTATALVSGALLAFALSFDEVIVTVFTAGAQNTLPLWIFGAIRLGQQLPEVNAVVSIVIAADAHPGGPRGPDRGRGRDHQVGAERPGRRGLALTVLAGPQGSLVPVPRHRACRGCEIPVRTVLTDRPSARRLRVARSLGQQASTSRSRSVSPSGIGSLASRRTAWPPGRAPARRSRSRRTLRPQRRRMGRGDLLPGGALEHVPRRLPVAPP